MQTKIVPNPGANNTHPENSFAWDTNPSVHNLLDVVVHILANEYVRAVKENPTLFSDKGDAK
jgi:hypothetical protein